MHHAEVIDAIDAGRIAPFMLHAPRWHANWSTRFG